MKHFLTFIAFFSIVTIGFSQVAIGVRFSYPFTMVQSMRPVTTNVPSSSMSFGKFRSYLNAGGFIRIPLQERFTLQIEGMFSIAEVDFDGVYQGQSFYSGYRFVHFDMPLLLQYEGKQPIRGFVQTGFSPKFYLWRENGLDRTYDISFADSRRFKKSLLMWHIGAGILIERKHWIFTLDQRFSMSVFNVSEHNNKEFLNLSKARFYLFSTSSGVAYKF
ncbi:porin family protein [Capnocytophaga sputigena]|uniref:porin family protein n=1 Tax=Capnocytophaga sputigena TaxID=1019 RepID=UPI0028D65C11|nr:porin family protein [Capnocytophaga sputigena]